MIVVVFRFASDASRAIHANQWPDRSAIAIDQRMTKSNNADSTTKNNYPTSRTTGADSVRFTTRWDCPYCETAGRTSTTLADADDSRGVQRAVTALRSHVLASVDDDHGPKSSLPDGVDHNSLHEHVSAIE